jgi:myo-inositol-1(or 4)-monophosphatase
MLKQTLIEATFAGAKILQTYFNGSFTISSKSNINDLVTQADKESEQAIFEVIRQQFPNHYLLSEESGEFKMESDIKWIIDPIDGTVNFANGIPICCVSIGVEQAGKMILGAVYNPFMNEFFFAERGLGSTLNDKLIKVNDNADVMRSCLVTGFPYSYLDEPNSPLEVFDRLIRFNIPMRRLGSAAIDLCWVAAGRFDGFYEHKLNAWDSAAGFLVVEEAGGKVTDYAGNYYSPYQPHLIATNGRIHDGLLAIINGTLESVPAI